MRAVGGGEGEVVSPLSHQSKMKKPEEIELSHSVDEEKAHPKAHDPHSAYAPLIFDAIGVHFHLATFLFQFFVHLFFLPFLLQNPAAQGFSLSKKDQSMIENYVYLPILFFFAHRVILSLKYASLSETEYDRFNKCKDMRLLDDYQSQIMLLSGWFIMDSEVLRFELGAASARMGERINNIHLVIPPPNSGQTAFNHFQYWNAFLRGQSYVFHGTKPAPELKLLPCGNYALSVYDLCLAIIRGSQKIESYMWLQNIMVNLVVLLIVIISIVPVFTNVQTVQSPFILTLFLMCYFYSITTYGRAYFTLLYVAIFDALRQLSMVSTLHCMIRLTELSMHARLSIAAQVSNCSQTYAQERLTAILSMSEVKHITCNHVKEGGEYCADAANCPAFYSDTAEEAMTSAVPQQAMPVLEGVLEEDSLFKMRVMEGEGEEAKDDDRPTLHRTDSKRISLALGETHVDESACTRYPRITFEFPQNIVAWTYARVTIMNFGDRFRNRMDIYIICTLLLAVALMVYALSQIATSADRFTTLTSPFFLLCFLIVSVLIIFLLLHSQVAASVNKELQSHRRTLGVRKLRIQSYINRFKHNNEECLETLELFADNLDSAMESVELNNELHPFKIFGMEATDALTLSIITTTLSFYSIVLSLFFSSSQTAGGASF